MSSLNYVDLFCGVGGFSSGFEDEGFKNIFSLDNNYTFCETYKENFPEHKLIIKNIEDVTKEEISKYISKNKIDVIIGGPPCQGFSIAGNIGRKFLNDPRNNLFLEFARIVSIIKPKIIVIENVQRLDIHNKGKTKEEIYNKFESLGYQIKSQVLNSVDYGVPQKRRRIIFIGSRINSKILFPSPMSKPYVTVKEAISKYPKLSSGEKSLIPNHIAMNHTEQMLTKMSFIKDGKGRENIPTQIRPKSGDVRKYIRYDSKKPSITVTGDMRKVFHYSQNRALTVRELDTLQSFKDNFTFKGSSISQQQQVGNAVPPLLARSIAKQIKKMLNEK